MREVFIKIVCFDWHIFVCFPTQDAMRLYYVCTAPHCGHRWTEWSLLIIKRSSTCFYAVAVSTRTVSIWVCVYSECIWLYKIAALLTPLLLLHGHSYLSPCCEYNVISFAVVLFSACHFQMCIVRLKHVFKHLLSLNNCETLHALHLWVTPWLHFENLLYNNSYFVT